jgi:hypothetical protein
VKEIKFQAPSTKFQISTKHQLLNDPNEEKALEKAFV